jgi:hypothetical protein
MAEPTPEIAAARCPWCSAVLPARTGDTCPSCGATLTSTSEPQVPGVTAIDPEAVIRGVRAASAPRRSRLLSFITGEPDEDLGAAPAPEALAPPPPDVRREMLRMEVEAEIADLTAEAGSLAADDAVDGRTTALAADQALPDAAAAEPVATGSDDATAADETAAGSEPQADPPA